MTAINLVLHTAALSEGAIAFVEKGRGKTIIFLHGIGSAARSWQFVLDLLPADRRALAWNAPGYLPSDALVMDWPSASDYAERLGAFLDHRASEPVHLVGHSLGCLIAARFARLSPHRVKTLTLASCALGHARLQEEERNRLLASRIHDIEHLGPRGMAQKRGLRLLSNQNDPQLVETVIETMAAVDPRGYLQASRMLSTGDLIGDIEQLPSDLPVQFIYGSADVITPPEANLRAAKARPGATVKVLEAAGHACYIEQPNAFLSAIEELVSKHV
jgi:pimeloyl-ACP methyl ester carboxylesterase